jgi:hypothetical protein
MGLMRGSVGKDGVYKGEAVCDLCGTAEKVTVEKEKITGTKPWRMVPFKYRHFIGCSVKCETELTVIAAREVKRDREDPRAKTENQRRPYPIAGTHEAALAGSTSG